MVRRYTKRLADPRAKKKATFSVHAARKLRSRRRVKLNMPNSARKMVKANVWKARPASKMSFGTFGLFWLDSALPIRAAPAICATVAVMSQTTKPHRIDLGFNHRRDLVSNPCAVAHPMSLLRQT